MLTFLHGKKSQGRRLPAVVWRPVNIEDDIFSIVFVSGLLSVLDGPQITLTDPVSPQLPLVCVVLKITIDCVGNVPGGGVPA